MTPLILGALWVIAAAVTATLPMRMQKWPGFALLILSPGLLLWVALDFGALPTALGLFALLSMFRRPLNYLARKLLRLPLPPLPPELRS